MTGAAVPRFDTVTIDCPNPAALATFYGELLEWPVPTGDGDYVALDTPGGGTGHHVPAGRWLCGPDVARPRRAAAAAPRPRGGRPRRRP